jgi:hypothetical protein
VDRPRESDLAAGRFAFARRLLISVLTGAFALGGGALITWLVLSGGSLRETVNPGTVLAYFRGDIALQIGLIGGLLFGLLRSGRPASTPTAPAVATAAGSSPQQAATQYLPPKK